MSDEETKDLMGHTDKMLKSYKKLFFALLMMGGYTIILILFAPKPEVSNKLTEALADLLVPVGVMMLFVTISITLLTYKKRRMEQDQSGEEEQ